MTDIDTVTTLPVMSVNPKLLQRLFSEEGLITQKQAAEILETSTAKVRNLIADGTLQSFASPMDRRLTLVRLSDVEALKEVRPTARAGPVKRRSPK